MEALIKSVEFDKEYQDKFGTKYSFKVGYDRKVGYYSSKSKDQNKFVQGQKAEFEEIEQQYNGGTYFKINWK